jgi:membrane-bound lytic murein transglycosylase B
MSRDNITYIQNKLNKLGFETGTPDGIAGPNTRAAARSYQVSRGIPADGYVGQQLFKQIQAESDAY